jgi:CRISPR-associated protein Csy1
VAALRDGGFETIVVQLGAHADAWTETIGRAAGRLLRLDGQLQDVAQRIADLQADLIIYPELGMDGRTLSLAALRLSPRQACAWGHPSTTGLPTIDAFFSCAEMEPPDAAAHYREPLRLLPGIGTVYAAPTLPAPHSRHELGLPTDRSLYLLPQSPFKLHPQADAVVVDIVQRDPQALIVLFAGPAHGATVHLQRRLRGALRAAGCDPTHSLHWLPMCPRDSYLAVNRACDVMLDSLHWSGGNASIDALTCGLPVITCPGALMRGRQSSAMLRRLHRGDWIANSPTQQAELAVAVARQRRERDMAADEAGMVEGIAALLGDPAPLAALVEHAHELLAHSDV